jgi:hypothetical protein
MQALHDVVKAGYVRYIGMSSCWAYQCECTSSLCWVSLTFVQSKPCRVRSQLGYILSFDLRFTQTMRSQTSSLPSSPCRTTTVYSIARRSARCSLLSRFFYSVDDISVATNNDVKMFGVGSIPWSPLARGALTRPLGQQTSRGQIDWQVFQNLHVDVRLMAFYRFIGNYAQASSYETIINRYAASMPRKAVILTG